MTFELQPSDIGQTNIPIVDDQHRHFIALINRIHSDASSAEGDRSWSTRRDELLAYATYHFSTEEGLMRDLGYPNLNAHAMEHRQFITDLQGLTAEIERGIAPRVQLIMFLWKWLVNHTNLADKELGTFIAEHGSRR